VESLTDRDGNQTRVERDAAGAPTAIVAPFGQRTALALDGKGLLQAIVDPAGGSVAMTYANGLLETYTDARGGVHRFTFDADGRLIKDENPAGGALSLTRTPTTTGFKVDVATALGRITSHQVDFTRSGATTWTDTDPAGVRTTSSQDEVGNWAIDYAGGSSVQLVEGPDPRFLLQAPVTSQFSFSTQGGLSLSRSEERSVELSDPADPLSVKQLAEKVTINGRAYTSTFDAASSQWTLVSPAGRKVVETLDAKGRMVRSEVAGLAPVTVAYDDAGRPTSTTQGARTTTYGYDGNGYLSSITDPLGRVEGLTNDVLGRPIKQTGPDGGQVLFTYDAASNITSATPPGRQSYAYGYTPVDMENSFTPPAVGSWNPATSYAYDADVALTGVSRPDGTVIGVRYDTAGRPAEIDYPRGPIALGYDATSRQLVSATTPQETLAWSYDGSLVTQASWSGVVNGSVGYSYDSNLRLAGTTVNGTLGAGLSYDDDGLLTAAENLVLKRDPKNGLVVSSDAGVVHEDYGYNEFGEATSFTAAVQSGSATLLAIQYERDGLGRIVKKVETVDGTTATYEYGYDAANRLEQVRTNGAVTASWAYDANGNRVSEKKGNSTITATYDGQDRLVTYGAATYSFGKAGELQERSRAGEGAPTQFRYDALGNLVGATLPDGTTIEYLVDAQGRRVGKRINGLLVQEFLWESQLRIAAELDGRGNVVSRFVYGTRVNVPELIVKGTETYRVITDHLGSPRLVVNARDAAVGQRIDYDEWGSVTSDSGSEFPFGFAGGLYERDLEVVRFGYRYYDPSIGRYLQPEPVLQSPGFVKEQAMHGYGFPLPYSYALNNPIHFTDKDGLYPKWDATCEKIKEYLDDMARQIKAREEQLAKNKGKLPFCKFGGKPSESVMGHYVLLSHAILRKPTRRPGMITRAAVTPLVVLPSGSLSGCRFLSLGFLRSLASLSPRPFQYPRRTA
jgi:RHS repeat-associated protein